MNTRQQPIVVSGLFAVGESTRHGIYWKPRLGAAATTTELLADTLVTYSLTFASAAAFAGINESDSYAVTLAGAVQSIAITGVTGTGASSLNVTYTAGTEVNGMPSWVNGSASIRWIEGYWHLYLSGFSQFVMKRPLVLPSTSPDDWDIHPSGSATGIADLGYTFSGTAPVLASGVSQKDFEGDDLLVGSTVSWLVQCTAGRIVLGWTTGLLVLSSGQHAQISIPGGQGAEFLGNFLTIVSASSSSAVTVHLAAMETPY